MKKITFNKKSFKALCLAFLMIVSCYNGSASAGIIIDSITSNFGGGVFFTLEFDDTEYGPLPFGPADIYLNGVTGIDYNFSSTPTEHLNVSMSDLQSGYIAAQLNEQGVVSITSFSLVLAKGDLSSEGHYYLDVGSNVMSLDYYSCDSTGSCSPEFTSWGRPFDIPLSVVSREAPLSDVPEPMTLSILLLGLLGIFVSRKIRQPENAKVILA